MDAIDAGAYLGGRNVSPNTVHILEGYDAFSIPVAMAASALKS